MKIVKNFQESFKNLWFLDIKGTTLYVNDIAVRIRAGLLLFIPIYMGFTLYDALYGSHWIATGNLVVDTLDVDFDGHILYTIEAIRKTFSYSTQTYVLLYGLFEMLCGMFLVTSRFSPTILISALLAHGKEPMWKPINPKRFAWSIGAIFISICLVFFNPDTFAHWVNFIFTYEVLPTTLNYMPKWIPQVLVGMCVGFMWLETVLGFCVGCKIHSLLVMLKVVDGECLACNNIKNRE